MGHFPVRKLLVCGFEENILDTRGWSITMFEEGTTTVLSFVFWIICINELGIRFLTHQYFME